MRFGNQRPRLPSHVPSRFAGDQGPSSGNTGSSAGFGGGSFDSIDSGTTGPSPPQPLDEMPSKETNRKTTTNFQASFVNVFSLRRKPWRSTIHGTYPLRTVPTQSRLGNTLNDHEYEKSHRVQFPYCSSSDCHSREKMARKGYSTVFSFQRSGKLSIAAAKGPGNSNFLVETRSCFIEILNTHTNRTTYHENH